MKRIFLVFFVFLMLLTGCSVPGTYMAGGVSTCSVKDKLLHSTLIPVNGCSVQNGYLRDELCNNYQYHIGSYDILNIVVWNHPELGLGNATSAVSSTSYTSLQSLAGSGSPIFSQSNSQIGGIFVDACGNIMFPLIGQVHVVGFTTSQLQCLLSKKLSKYIRDPKVSVQVIAFNSQRVNIIGEVVTPGVKPLNDRPLTILDAINLCGGVNTLNADTGRIFVIRGGVDKDIKVYWLDASSPESLLLAQHFHLADNDIVYVAPSRAVSWNKVVNLILPTIQTIWFTWSTIHNVNW